MLAVRVEHPQFGKLQPCRCREQVQAERQATERARLVASLQTELGPRLAKCHFGTFDRDRPIDGPYEAYSVAQQQAMVRQAHRAAWDYAQAPCGWLALFGSPGAGKSHLAAAIANELAARRIAVVYASVPSQLRWIQDGIDDGSSAPRLRALMEAPVLVLDDLGTEQKTAWRMATLLEIFQHRYNQALPTVVTSNVQRCDIEYRIADRIDELARIATLYVQSYRGEIRRQREQEEL